MMIRPTLLIVFAALAVPLVALPLAGCGQGAQSPSPESGAAEATEPAGEEAAPTAPVPHTEAPAPAPAQPRAAAPRPAAPKPTHETVRMTVPVGTRMQLSLASDLATDANQTGDRFEAEVMEAVYVDDRVVIPAGSVVEGELTEVKRAKKLTGGAGITLAFREIRLPSGYRTRIAARLTSEGAKSGKKSAAIIGGSAAGGAILGKVLGKDSKDAAIGSIIGGAIGAGVAATRDKELRIPAGTTLEVATEEPLQVPVKVKVEG